MLNNFSDRLRVYLPVERHSELFGKITDNQMTKLKEKLGSFCPSPENVKSDQKDTPATRKTLLQHAEST